MSNLGLNLSLFDWVFMGAIAAPFCQYIIRYGHWFLYGDYQRDPKNIDGGWIKKPFVWCPSLGDLLWMLVLAMLGPVSIDFVLTFAVIALIVFLFWSFVYVVEKISKSVILNTPICNWFKG